MGGLSRFLLGGAVGAALGIMISQRRRQKPQKVSPWESWEAAGPGATSGLARSTRPATDVVEPQPEPQPESVPATTQEPAIAAELIAEPEIIAEAQPPMEPESIAQPVAETIAEPATEAEPVAETAFEPPMEQVAELVAEPVAETIAEPPTAAELLIEPANEPPMEPVAEPVAEPELIAEAQPAAEFEPEGMSGEEEGVIGEAAVFEPALPDLGSPFDVVVAPDLLEQPLPGAGWEPSLTPLAEEDVDEVYPVPAEPEIVDFEKVPVVEAPPLSGDSTEGSGEVLAPEGIVTPSISADDLKARIEETRRRIRRELDEPFLGEADITPAAKPAVGPAAEIMVEPIPEPAAELVTEPMAETISQLVSKFEETIPQPVPEVEDMAAEETAPLISDVGEPVFPEQEPVESGPESDSELLDFEVMKARIEQTRSRLKAKAFDAMMSGESSLLSREEPGKASERRGPAVLDQELDRKIESGLREQEE